MTVSYINENMYETVSRGRGATASFAARDRGPIRSAHPATDRPCRTCCGDAAVRHRRSYWLLLVARLAQGIASGMSWVAALSLIAVTTPMEKRGQSMGIALSTITLGVLVGPPLAGFLVEHFGTASPFLFAAVVTLVDGILRIVLVKDSPRVTDDTAGPLAVLRVPGHSPSSWPSPLARPCFLLLNPSCRCTLAPTR